MSDILMSRMTDTMETGYITYIGIEEGKRIPINSIIAKIENNVR